MILREVQNFHESVEYFEFVERRQFILVVLFILFGRLPGFHEQLINLVLVVIVYPAQPAALSLPSEESFDE